jgi:hypothetical protein
VCHHHESYMPTSPWAVLLHSSLLVPPNINTGSVSKIGFNLLLGKARSELMLFKGCVIVAYEGHTQYCEWPLLERITQPFYSVNSQARHNSICRRHKLRWSLACSLKVANFESGVSSFCFHVSCSPC